VDGSAPRRRAWLAYLACGVLATLLYAVDVVPTVDFAVVGVGTVLALFLGPVWNGVRPRLPWRLLGSAGLLFTVGAVLRPIVGHAAGLTVLVADAFTVPGYLLMISALGYCLFAGRGIERHALIDGLIVCVGVAVACTLLFAVPAVSIHGRPVLVSALAGVYPPLDAILVLLVAKLAFTTAARRPSFVLTMVCVGFMMIGDVAYEIIGVGGELYGSRFLDLPFMLSFTTIGAAGLHPSATDLGRAMPLPVQEWSWRRLMLIVPALALPSILITVRPDRSVIDHTILGVGGGVLVLLLLTRAVSAVEGYAAAQRRYEHQATHDPLTGLPNRRALTAAVERIVDAGAPDGSLIWMFFLDLDGFKFVNDSWGHSAGDRLIVDVGARLRAALPEPVTVTRVGGDEFVVVKLCTRPEAMSLAQRIMACFAEPMIVANAEVVINASMGIASAAPDPGSTVTAEALMRDADTALYRTKSERRGTWTVFDASMHEAVLERVELEVALRAALANEQLHLAFQPIVDLPTGRVVGAEALARWTHPERGPIAPDVFIPIAEDSRLIAALGSWVLGQSIRQLARWRADGLVGDDFWMSVNVSPRQLTDAGLPGLLAHELQRWRVPPGLVVLEITESVMLEGSVTTDRVLKDLRGLGVGLSVDDFGTGFSALGYLRRHPVNGVKVDRSFVAGLGTNAEDEEIVRAVVAMSTALGLSVVAEGVETPAQRDVLAGLGVPLGQGWLWGRAVEPTAFAAQWGRTRSLVAQAAGNS
jgi:diguanylate cyclase (GGDEF)-like protein